MAYKHIQLMALTVPNQLILPFNLYALTVPQQWKELFTRLQRHKLGKNYVLPPVESLNPVIQLLFEDILFFQKGAFKLGCSVKWLYCKTDQIPTQRIAEVIKTWLRISFENSDFLTDEDVTQIQAISGDDLRFERVSIPDPIWRIVDGKLEIDNLFYSLFPYLCSSAVASGSFSLINPSTGNVSEEVIFYPSALEGERIDEAISWPPIPVKRPRKRKGSNQQEEVVHYYSYCLKFALHYDAGGFPYLICDAGIRRWVSWRLGYLPSATSVCIKPVGATQFAACKLRYAGKERGIEFENNLIRLLQELKYRDRFAVEDVIASPYKNSELVWATVYNNQMSTSHNVNPGFFPVDIVMFQQACIERFQQILGTEFSLLEPYSRCSNDKSLRQVSSAYSEVEKFVKSHFATVVTAPPFYIPPDLRLVLLAQSQEAKDLIVPLAKKYGITDVEIYDLGVLGAELPGTSWKNECSDRIRKFQQSLHASSPNQKTLTLIEILPKEMFWQDSKKDPKPCFRPALAMLGSVTDHFEPKAEDDTEDFLNLETLSTEITRRENKAADESEDKFFKAPSLKSNFAHRVENTLLTGLSMAGAYVYPSFAAEDFPTHVASVGVYLIPFYCSERTEYLPVAVCMSESGVTAKAYGCNDWLDFHSFQIQMCTGKMFQPIKLDKSAIQAWVFNNLFQETKQPTLFCFDVANLHTKGLSFLQKKQWQKHSLAFDVGRESTHVSLRKYPYVRIASIITPYTSQVPLYRALNKRGELAGHTEGVFYPPSQGDECGHYYLSNQRPDSRSGGILQESKLLPMVKTKGKNVGQPKKPKPHAQGYNPRGIFLNLTLQENDRFSDWASFVQCLRLYGLIHYLDATILPAPLHLAAGLDNYRPIHALGKL
ncbi:DUF3962 domain-containing protein [Oscillatoria sp. FACHB-1407]|uniref:pPIWI_RE module domain-containing protein n=1 Tax=Oscillatoria sp. FACHB-1407 TaxID=2692847 RepID=UPI001685E088|nr:DUF3962 domain-containing protein [Oscillatoria sp. FACHB-1407]MBD2465393.1 DUF3962 domain-containing protein [Oscillatoria sp. FACHB-1407]